MSEELKSVLSKIVSSAVTHPTPSGDVAVIVLPVERLHEIGAAISAAPDPRVQRLEEALREMVDAANGLSFGVDWNNGTHAKHHRQKLLDALPAARAALSEDGKA